MTLQEAHEARAAYQSAVPATRKAFPELKERFIQAIGFIEGWNEGAKYMRELAADESEIESGWGIPGRIRELPIAPSLSRGGAR